METCTNNLFKETLLKMKFQFFIATTQTNFNLDFIRGFYNVYTKNYKNLHTGGLFNFCNKPFIKL